MLKKIHEYFLNIVIFTIVVLSIFEFIFEIYTALVFGFRIRPDLDNITIVFIFLILYKFFMDDRIELNLTKSSN